MIGQLSSTLPSTLLATTALMLLVLALRGPARRAVGPRLAYLLWALPALRLVLPALPVDLWSLLPASGAAAVPVVFTGPSGPAVAGGAPSLSAGTFVSALWLAGALGLLAVYTVRHARYCRRLRAAAFTFGYIDGIRILAADVDGPLAFGVIRRYIVVPRHFARDYAPAERGLALAHERAHHARGDILANWLSLVVLAAHWWNPIAWAAINAFRQDQELAADATVLAGRLPPERRLYAHVLAKAAGVGAPPASHLNSRANLKGRLLMIAQPPRSARRMALGVVLLPLFGSVAIAATMPATGHQATTIGVKPDGKGSYALIIGASAFAPGASLPGGMTLPTDFVATDCSLKPDAKPRAMAIKGVGKTRTYTVMCASAGAAPVRATLREGLASLDSMRTSVASQPASAVFPESERAHALGAIDRSLTEVKAALAALG